MSLFGIFSEYGFSGVYSSATDSNSLIIKDPVSTPGLKLYTGDGGFFEIWTGSTTLFEHPGAGLPPYAPISYEHEYYLIDHIGRVAFANNDFALGQSKNDHGVQWALSAPKKVAVQVRDQLGSFLHEAIIGPGLPPLTWQGETVPDLNHPSTFLIRVNGGVPTQITLPLSYQEQRHMQKHLAMKGGDSRVGLEEVSNTRRETTVRDAVDGARTFLSLVEKNNEPSLNQERLLALCYGCYRLGQFELCLKLVNYLDDQAERDYLNGLIAWEQGAGEVDFAAAGLDSYYLRAVQDYHQGHVEEAVRWLDQLLKVRPYVMRPALLRAYLLRDSDQVQELITSHPASIEALHVAGLLGDDVAADAARKMQQNNPEASKHIQQFNDVLQRGVWKHLPRYQPAMP